MDITSVLLSLEVNGNTYGPDQINEWNVTGLSENTTYTYTIKVTDGTITENITGQFTTLCEHTWDSSTGTCSKCGRGCVHSVSSRNLSDMWL